MIAALVISIVFGIITLTHLLGNSSQGNWVSFATISVTFGGLYLYHYKQKQQKTSMEQWAIINQKALLNGESVDFNGQEVNTKTRLVQFMYGASFLVITTKQPTGYYIAGTPLATLGRIQASVLTFIFGWWGIPWGPVYAIQCLYHNIAHAGHYCRVEDLLYEEETPETTTP